MPQGRKGHYGFDISTPGNDVYFTAYAPFDGIIRRRYVNGYGRVLILESGNLWLWYAHIGTDGLPDGAYVKQGQPLFRIEGPYGWSGRGTGAMLHLEVRPRGAMDIGKSDDMARQTRMFLESHYGPITKDMIIEGL